MVRVMKIFKDTTYPYNGVALFADEKDDVQPGMDIEGLPDGFVIPWGSYVITGDGELGFYLSDDTWNWPFEEE